MTTDQVRRGVTALICAPIVAALSVAFGNESATVSAPAYG